MTRPARRTGSPGRPVRSLKRSLFLTLPTRGTTGQHVIRALYALIRLSPWLLTYSMAVTVHTGVV